MELRVKGITLHLSRSENELERVHPINPLGHWMGIWAAGSIGALQSPLL
jgi:hypothetical protein